jgi:hypothetical protein
MQKLKNCIERISGINRKQAEMKKGSGVAQSQVKKMMGLRV